MRNIFILLFLFLIASCSESNSELVTFANNFELIAETDDAQPTLSARIFKLREFGECTNGNCPKEVLLIAVSEFGEYPEQKLYKTPLKEKWEFVEWNHIPVLGEPHYTLKFTLKSKSNNKEAVYSVNADLEDIKYKEK